MPNPGVVKSEMSCYDIAGCDLSFGTWLTTTTRAKRRRRERPLQCCRRPLSPMTPFSRRKQSEPVDPPTLLVHARSALSMHEEYCRKSLRRTTSEDHHSDLCWHRGLPLPS